MTANGLSLIIARAQKSGSYASSKLYQSLMGAEFMRENWGIIWLLICKELDSSLTFLCLIIYKLMMLRSTGD